MDALLLRILVLYSFSSAKLKNYYPKCAAGTRMLRTSDLNISPARVDLVLFIKTAVVLDVIQKYPLQFLFQNYIYPGFTKIIMETVAMLPLSKRFELF
jgi:hypothetical protein